MGSTHNKAIVRVTYYGQPNYSSQLPVRSQSKIVNEKKSIMCGHTRTKTGTLISNNLNTGAFRVLQNVPMHGSELVQNVTFGRNHEPEGPHHMGLPPSLHQAMAGPGITCRTFGSAFGTQTGREGRIDRRE
jgi:hypothetical protein